MTATLRGLLAIAMLAGLYLIPVALVFSALFLLSFFVNIVAGSQQPGIFTPFLLIFGGLGLWVLLYVVFTTVGVTGTPQDASAAISRDQAPGLWNQMTALAKQAGTRPPAELRLSARANAEVVEETRWLGLIPVTRRMYLGIPLLLTLPPEQLGAVMCHELGHYARGHTRVGAVCYRARAAADLMLDRISLIRARARRRGLVTELHFWLVLGYTQMYRRLSTAATQNQEFQADAQAALIAGPQHTAAALHTVHAMAAGWREFAARMECQLARGGDTEDPFDEFRDRWLDPRFRQEERPVQRADLPAESDVSGLDQLPHCRCPSRGRDVSAAIVAAAEASRVCWAPSHAVSGPAERGTERGREHGQRAAGGQDLGNSSGGLSRWNKVADRAGEGA
jgi:Zn-dependent protease with chaperone function